jgi:8-oxo-dGTP diphosphatase
MSRSWVVAWVTPKALPPVPLSHEDACFLMVKHVKRGWELPGGWIESGEDAEMAALREVFEETGLLGTAKSVAKGLAEGGGHVVWVEIDEDPTPVAWTSADPAIEEVGWCLEPPEPLAWSLGELVQFAAHDWPV